MHKAGTETLTKENIFVLLIHAVFFSLSEDICENLRPFLNVERRLLLFPVKGVYPLLPLSKQSLQVLPRQHFIDHCLFTYI